MNKEEFIKLSLGGFWKILLYDIDGQKKYLEKILDEYKIGQYNKEELVRKGSNNESRVQDV